MEAILVFWEGNGQQMTSLMDARQPRGAEVSPFWNNILKMSSNVREIILNQLNMASVLSMLV